MVCSQEGEDDEDMTPLDMTIDNYKLSSFIYLHNNFWYDSLGSTCICHYLLVDMNVSQSARSSMPNFQFASGPISLYWEGQNSFVQSDFEVHTYFMKILFDKLSNGSSLTSISCWQGLQIIKTCCCYFYRELHQHHELVIYP